MAQDQARLFADQLVYCRDELDVRDGRIDHARRAQGSGAVCRHLKIAGRVRFFTIFSGYQLPPPKLQHIR